MTKALACLLVIIALLGSPFVAQAQDYAPAVDQLSLMGMRYYAHSGGFMVEGLQLVFPPQDDPGAELTVTNAAGEVVANIPLQVRRWDDWPAFGVLAASGPGIGHLNAPGDYTMTVRLSDNVIGALAYSLIEDGGGDPFNPQKTYHREGPWRSLGYLSSPTEKPDEALRFNYWTSLREVGTSGQTKIALSLKRGNQEVAVSRSDYVVSNADWQFFSHQLAKPDRKFNFTLADLTSQDGTYTLTLLATDKTVKTYTLSVQNGAVVPSPRSALSSEPRGDFLSPRRVNTSSGSGSRYFMEHVFWVEASDS